MSGRTGLVSYTGDSEISDEDELETEPTTHAPAHVHPSVVVQGLGIPSSRLKHRSPTPTLLPAVVQSAPRIGGLVAYNHDEDEMNESKNDSVFLATHSDDDVIETGEGGVSRSGGGGGGGGGGGIPLNMGDLLGGEDSQPASTYSLEETDEPKSETEYADLPSKPLFLSVSGVTLPPEPQGKCSKALQDKVVALLQKEQKLGLDLNKHLQTRKDFRNPSIYEKLVELCKLDEFGTNFPEWLYDPKGWGEESQYSNLLEAQKKSYEKKEKAKLQDRTKIEFVKGTKRPAGSSALAPTGAEATKKARKSKWDVSTTDSGGSRGGTPKQLGEVGAQARAQATQLGKELSKLAK